MRLLTTLFLLQIDKQHMLHVHTMYMYIHVYYRKGVFVEQTCSGCNTRLQQSKRPVKYNVHCCMPYIIGFLQTATDAPISLLVAKYDSVKSAIYNVHVVVSTQRGNWGRG